MGPQSQMEQGGLMKKVCVCDFPRMENFHGYSIDFLDPVPYLLNGRSWSQRIRTLGQDERWVALRRLYESKWVDQLYREKDPSYMRYVGDFVEKFRNADLLVFANYNPIHPEILCKELPNPIKVLGFVDDPISTYVRGIPYLWAFDGALYISPSYNDRLLFKEALKLWGCEQSYWWPLVQPKRNAANKEELWPHSAPRDKAVYLGDDFFSHRDLDLIYVGAQYGPKVDRLIQLRKRFGSRLKIHGRWPLAGLGGMARGLKGKPVLWGRIRSISDQERTNLYYRTKIGINMHFSPTPMETGNMRMYEVPGHGMMMLCDKAGLNAHEQIFEPDKEAVFYDSTADAIEKIEYYLAHDEERLRIARAGFTRVHKDYDGEMGLKRLLDWASALPRSSRAGSISCSLTT